uniref:CDP-diacylglycerol--glycerol-3-phosphate 3-phosphatidyltransferase n=1 Tax=Candidatus Kentrum sp. TUN TaxID=2126343 RepID=A0A451AF27_9GAMM|nr:MAG: CDP-diacylglycerol--glycerol-3-phosphate 3-phosphatidyltransferase [Candidatus Kentron sp. TUN]VFK64657.1 MAG: CDP-diacylglycerol--glycerol-3-phosphate 3-phosphatidyltransferase [Candidatus Kentron sp. TUN]VFK70363.1 MAG: CDP-diacylglycerol--glycerol-3-phosphate 3-phosphatidyltransferase [Candidatus Kentron sp. TUN]
MDRRHIPNLITGLRFLLTPPVVLFLVFDEYLLALGIFFVAGLSDGVDGFLAKRYGWKTRLGSILDPLADKTLLLATFITLGGLSLIPLWLVGLIILRDAIIVGWAAAYQAITQRLEVRPNLFSKINTVTQILLALAVMFFEGTGFSWDGLENILVVLVFVTTILSGAIYLIEWAGKTREALHK